MTLPEVCDCNESAENMPNNTAGKSTTTTTTAADIATSSSTTSNSAADNHTQTVGEALKTVLQQASSQGRVTCSLTASVDVLSTCPDDVMLCVMPLLAHPDASATIQSTLIRAVCLEHNIRVLSVDCDVKLAKTVVCSGDVVEEGMAARAASSTTMMMMMSEDEEEEEEEDEVDDNCNKVLKAPSACYDDAPLFFSGCDNLAPVMGFPCVLVRYPGDGASKEDELVAEFCKEQLFGGAQQDPYIELPD